VTADPRPAPAANVVPHTAETVPREKYELLCEALERANQQLVNERGTTELWQRECGKRDREIADLLDEGAQPAEVEAFLTWWCRQVGHKLRPDGKPMHASIGPGSERAKAYRKLRREWTDRALALMIIGMQNHRFRPYRERSKADVLYLAQPGNQGLREEALAIGLALKPHLDADLKTRRARKRPKDEPSVQGRKEC
jgi:hypothetical protein